MTNYINYNGNFVPSDKPIINASNRAFRYGDGIFETIRVSNHSIALADYHFERLFSGIRLLKFNPLAFFTPALLQEQILELCAKNNHSGNIRVRLMVFRGDGGLYDPDNDVTNYIIESQPLYDKENQKNKNGLQIDIFPDGIKAVDLFSNLKSNNYLVSVMGALYAKAKQLDDCIILNSQGRICETTISNIFCIREKTILTPALSEGCVAGVMRRHLLTQLKKFGFEVIEQPVDNIVLEDADEIFLTNAISIIRSVASFRNRTYRMNKSSEIRQELIKEFS